MEYDERCKKWIEDFMTKINMILFGADEEHGILKRIQDLEGCVKQKISKLWLLSTALVVIAILCTIFLPAINSGIKTLNEVKAMEIRLTERVAANSTRINKHEQDVCDQIKQMENNIINNFDLKMQVVEERCLKTKEKEEQ